MQSISVGYTEPYILNSEKRCMKILRDAFNFIDNGKGQAVSGCTSSEFNRSRIGLESLASLAIVIDTSDNILIQPKTNLPRKGLELLIARMTRLVHVNFMLDLSK